MMGSKARYFGTGGVGQDMAAAWAQIISCVRGIVLWRR